MTLDYLRPARMDEGIRVSRSNLRNLYWTPAQLVTHHASNGCNLQPGDLLGSGTVSGPEDENLGCLLELTRNGREPVSLNEDEQRGFLEDGDEVVLSLHYQAGLQASPARIQIEREPDPFDPIPLLRLKVPAPTPLITLTWDDRR